jgi:hypothetical protein
LPPKARCHCYFAADECQYTQAETKIDIINANANGTTIKGPICDIVYSICKRKNTTTTTIDGTTKQNIPAATGIFLKMREINAERIIEAININEVIGCTY